MLLEPKVFRGSISDFYYVEGYNNDATRWQPNAVKSWSTPGIVLHTSNLRESDSWLSILTESFGRVTALARSARNSRKRFMGGIDLLDCGVFQLAEGRSPEVPFILEALDQRETWLDLRSDLQKYSLASYCIELTLHFAQENDRDGAALFVPLHLTLRSINKSTERDHNMLFAVYYNLVMLNIGGFNVIDDSPRLEKSPELREWFSAMLEGNQAILPHNRPLLSQGLQLLAHYTQEIIGREVRSISAVLNSKS